MHLNKPTIRTVILIAIILKLMSSVYLLYIHWDNIPGLTFGDARAYLHTSNRLATTGTYSLFDDSERNPVPYAGRLPGYDIVLAPIFMIFNDARIVANVVISLQLLLSCISLYFFYRLLLIFIKHSWVSIIFTFLFAINPFTGLFDYFIYTESFSISALVIGLSLSLGYRNKTELIVGSLFLLWAYLLRPPVLPICLMGWLYPILSTKNFRLSYTLIPIFLFTLVWAGRNYVHFKQFIPVTSDLYGGYQFPQYQFAVFSLIASWGGDITWWKEDADIRIFFYYNADSDNMDCHHALTYLPSYIYTSKYNADSICNLRNEIINFRRGGDSKEDDIVTTLTRYENSFKKEKPFSYFIKAPFRLLVNFIAQNGAQYMYLVKFSELNTIEKFIKFFHHSTYWGILFFAFFGSLLLVLRGGLQAKIISLSFLFILFVFPIILRRIEYRYIIHLIPLAFILTSIAIELIRVRINEMKAIHPIKDEISNQ